MNTFVTNELITLAIKAIVIPVILVFVKYGVDFLRIKIAHLTNSQYREYLDSCLSELNNAVVTAVGQVSQTYVDSLKKDGKFNLDEQEEAFDRAYHTSIQILSSDAYNFLKKQLTNDGLTEMITSKIEEAVGFNKQLNK